MTLKKGNLYIVKLSSLKRKKLKEKRKIFGVFYLLFEISIKKKLKIRIFFIILLK